MTHHAAGSTFPGAVRQILSSQLDDQLLSDLLDALPIGVVVLDTQGRVTRYNAYEQEFARRSAASVLGRDFFREVAPCTAASALLVHFERYMAGDEALSIDLSFQFPFAHLPTPRDVRLRLRGFSSNGQRFAFLLVEDVTEEVQARRLRELLATLVAHDMKNPLASMKLNVDMVLRDLGQAGRVGERLVDARNAADRLDRMLRLFLDVYRLEQADLPVTLAPVDPRKACVELLQLEAPIAQSYDLSLELLGDAPQVETDGTLLLRILENLVDNAMRHAQKAIRLELRSGQDFVEIDVSDDGPGVPDSAKARIFDKFESMSPDLRGFNQGLGLTFCSLAASRLRGTITVHDAAPRGAIFRLRLPLAAND